MRNIRPVAPARVVWHLLFFVAAVVVAQSPSNNTTTNSSTTTNNNATTMVDDDSTTTAPRPDCYTTFRDLWTDMGAKDPFSFETFVVCPGTTIEIGETTDNMVFTNGDRALDMRQFSKVYCGADGSSANNCTVRGGRIQLIVEHNSWNDEDKKRMEVKGFTFEAARVSSVLTVFAEGDLLIEDCIFRNHVEGGILSAAVANLLRPDVTFHKCVFENNKISSSSSSTSMFTAAGGAHLTITDSVFANNNYASDTALDTSAIYVHDNVLLVTMLTLQNNCFFGNNFKNRGLVSVKLAESLVEVQNNFGANDDVDLQCQFIYVAATGGTCIAFDAKTCPIAGVDAPPVQPVPSPSTGAETGQPSAATMRRAVLSPWLWLSSVQSPERYTAIMVLATAVVMVVAVLQHLM